jgi:CheY-like chemotaxis protein
MAVGAPIRIVLVDDDDGVAEFLEATFASDPRFELLARGRVGSEALSLVRRYRPDAVLMDLNMPVMGGVDAIRELIADDPEVCAIAFTATTDEQEKEAARRAAAVAVLSKPCDPVSFLDALEKHAKACAARAA